MQRRFVGLVIAVATACGTTSSKPGEVNVRGLTVEIPSGWHMDWEPDSTVMLFPPGDSSVTLRVSTLTGVTTPGTSSDPFSWLDRFPELTQSPIDTPWVRVAVTSVDSIHTERGQRVRMRYWYRAEARPPDVITLGIFSLAQVIPTDTTRFDSTAVSSAERVVRTARYTRY